MFDKLMQTQAKMAEVKARLDNITVIGEAENGKVKIELTANKITKSVSISPDLLNDREQLEDLLAIAFNRALEQAEKVNAAEMQNAAKDMLPGMGNLFGK